MTPTGFQHEAIFYRDGDEFLAAAVPFLRGGLEAGDPALVAVGRGKAEALKAALGSDAALIRFADMQRIGRNPACILPLWRRFLDEHGGGGSVRGIGEPVWPGRTPIEVDECHRHEALLDYAFWDGPAWRLLCPYDSAALDDDVLEAAHRSHRRVCGSAARQGWAVAGLDSRPSPEPFAGALPPPPPGAISLRFDRPTLREARALAARHARRLGLSSDRAFDLVAAVGELTANSVMHGGGGGVLRVWTEAGALIAEVRDSGAIDDPLAGRVRPAPSQAGGRGLWLANHLCDLLQIRSGAGGTTVRLRMERRLS